MTQVIRSLPVLVLFPHRRCNCRCVMCDIWKETGDEELSFADLQRHVEDIQTLGVKWVVFSGGEPLMHSDLFRLCSLLRSLGIRVTLLTTGLLLERHAKAIAATVDDLIVSLDGPEALHDQIRRVRGAYEHLACGVKAIHDLAPALPVAARSTVQRLNYRHLRETAKAAQQIGCRSISFLAADISARAFNRPEDWRDSEHEQIALSEWQIQELESEIDSLIAECSGFVLEDRAKLARIVLHFRAHIGLADPVAPRCNAPWVSAVVESNGLVRPCFFHDPIGRVGPRSLLQVVNGFEALAFRSGLNVATDPICKRCVCSLHWKDGV